MFRKLLDNASPNKAYLQNVSYFFLFSLFQWNKNKLLPHLDKLYYLNDLYSLHCVAFGVGVKPELDNKI